MFLASAPIMYIPGLLGVQANVLCSGVSSDMGVS